MPNTALFHSDAGALLRCKQAAAAQGAQVPLCSEVPVPLCSEVPVPLCSEVPVPLCSEVPCLCSLEWEHMYMTRARLQMEHAQVPARKHTHRRLQTQKRTEPPHTRALSPTHVYMHVHPHPYTRTPIQPCTHKSIHRWLCWGSCLPWRQMRPTRLLRCARFSRCCRPRHRPCCAAWA